MIVHDVIQRSPEWHTLKLGLVGSSQAADMLAKRQDGKPTAGRANLLAQLLLEILTSKPQGGTYQSRWMEQGADREDSSLEAYEALTGRIYRKVGFCQHETLRAGFSPDGVIGDFEGVVEAKCPIPATHLDYLLTGKVPENYRKQVVHGLWITGARYCDWLSFNPDFPDEARVKLVRIDRDDTEIAEYERQIRIFLAELDLKLKAYRTALNLKAVLAEAVA